MENPEEVLQALDEFQKMRPSEIPRELEDYLCWVARTGDPVYQWSLIKALFREKLMRVMTDFYENCPTLDLTPCPNVEQFNYDIMKSTLLERLESFANAPFTVQRICELLTTPRKEYNRIDKFMRAIEKNILVVSTREPGPYGRRSENGDSLVNGSIEDETSHHGQTSNEVEMESWVKDCTETTAVPVNPESNDDISVENGLNLPLKTAFSKHERIEQISAVDATTSSFVTSTVDFSTATTANTQIAVQETATVVQNLTTVNHDAVAIVGDVSDAIMNEDTSSQPSLELESDDNDSSESKKLQTTFQAKDFSLDEVKSPKIYSEALKGVKTEDSIECNESSKECDQLIESAYLGEKLLNESTDDSENSDKKDNLDTHSTVSEIDQVDKKFVTKAEDSENCESKSSTCGDSLPLINNNLDVKKDEVEDDAEDSTKTLIEEKCDIDVKNENTSESVIEENRPDVSDSSENDVKELSKEVETEASNTEDKISVEESPLVTTDSDDTAKVESVELTLEKSVEDNMESSKTAVSNSIPIIEEPKDTTELVAKDASSSVSVTEVTSELEDDTSTIKNDLAKLPTESSQVEDNEMIISSCEEAQSNKGTTESMDIDNEGLMSSAQQDEPMEQETIEAMNS
ncbi:PREDICTED: serine/threonine-protein phosphatase 4 regulatory subunit 2 [Ceratosolen solmsi marchali]|uniref:Serine/threonine-protein phosphatase 4 regulatory subunit 2 n=1 Tax=Ceratosolen solmsi marchali TaxID=326594 RepID=A0AAJ6YNX6_9HYME|nr:PREDICTED: serine/threonine-protein phosphatase 4 regulatory subunit 2 [Ceratosolen solmsi marchali]